MSGPNRARQLLTPLLLLLALLSGVGVGVGVSAASASTCTTTTGVAAYVYDSATVARVGSYTIDATGATQFSGTPEGSVSPSSQVRDTVTTSSVSVVATNTADDALRSVDEAASGQVTVLGRFRGGTEEYLGKPGFNVLDLPSKGTGRWYWSRNEAFIDDAIAAGDEIRLVTNPFEPIYSGGNTFQREIRYLKDLGYTFQKSGDHWVAVPGR